MSCSMSDHSPPLGFPCGSPQDDDRRGVLVDVKILNGYVVGRNSNAKYMYMNSNGIRNNSLPLSY